MSYKQPRSIQVVMFSESEGKRIYLLLKRLETHGGFWQSVTGSLEEGETHQQAAVREVFEETGFRVLEEELIDLGLVNNFEIAAQWLPRYAPGVTHNEEVCFGLRVGKTDVAIDHSEHEAYVWVEFESALNMLYWISNKRALTAVEELEASSSSLTQPSR